MRIITWLPAVLPLPAHRRPRAAGGDGSTPDPLGRVGSVGAGEGAVSMPLPTPPSGATAPAGSVARLPSTARPIEGKVLQERKQRTRMSFITSLVSAASGMWHAP